MFAKTIVLSDAFLDMPMSARCLYYTLGMLADDDGFINAPRSIMRQCGATDDDMKILLAKKFVLGFDSGVLAVKHWRINNYLQKDRIQPTKYIEEKAQLKVDENGAYTLSCIQGDVYTEPVYTDDVYTDKDRIGKESIDKDRIDQHNAQAPAIGKVMDYYMDNINPVPSPFAVERLKHFTEVLGPDVVIHACALAQDDRKGWSYIHAILQRYENQGLDSMAKVEQDEQQRRDVQEARKPNRIITAAEYATRQEKPVDLDELKKFADSFG